MKFGCVRLENEKQNTSLGWQERFRQDFEIDGMIV